jgi:hypothetical protein
MITPEEKIEEWKKHISKEVNENMLNCILEDLRVELGFVEDWQSSYEDLIEDVEDKLEKIKEKQK